MSILVRTPVPLLPGANLVDPVEPRAATVGPAVTAGSRPRSHRVPACVVLAVVDFVAVVSLTVAIGLVGSRSATPALTAPALGLLWVVLLFLTRAYETKPVLGGRPQASGVLRAGAALGLLCWIGPTLIEVTAPPEAGHRLVGARQEQ